MKLEVVMVRCSCFHLLLEQSALSRVVNRRPTLRLTKRLPYRCPRPRKRAPCALICAQSPSRGSHRWHQSILCPRQSQWWSPEKARFGPAACRVSTAYQHKECNSRYDSQDHPYSVNIRIISSECGRGLLAHLPRRPGPVDLVAALMTVGQGSCTGVCTAYQPTALPGKTADRGKVGASLGA